MSTIPPTAYSILSHTRVVDTAPAEASKAPSQDPAAAGAISDFRQALSEAERAAMQTVVSGADPHAMVEALATAELVLDTAASVRDRVVEAYQELLRMPV